LLFLSSPECINSTGLQLNSPKIARTDNCNSSATSRFTPTPRSKHAPDEGQTRGREISNPVEKRGRNERGYLDGDGGVVGGVGLEHHFVVGEHHDVGLDLLGDALGPRRRQVEPHRARPRRQQRQRRGGKSQQKSPRGRRHCPRPPDLAALLRSRATRGSLDWTFFLHEFGLD
jgi:hypothetical protein